MSTLKLRTFKDDDLQEAFSRNGYVVINLAEASVMKHLAEDYQALYPDNRDGCVFSCHDSDSDRRSKAEKLLHQVVVKRASDFLDAYRYVSSSFVAKYPGENGVITPHTDYTFVDDMQYDAVAIWAPLTDITTAAGRLHVLPGSHRYTPLCGSNLFRKYTDIQLADMTEIDVSIGQAVCYNLRTIHASPANTSLTPRVAVNCVMIPKEADIWHVTREDQEILIYAVDNEFYSRLHFDGAITKQLLKNYTVIHSEPYVPESSEYVTPKKLVQPTGILQRVMSRLGMGGLKK
jgi:ectoine hydroxylase-related dioxygenase (phytanoyl-CoA dioxygenase family)